MVVNLLFSYVNHVNKMLSALMSIWTELLLCQFLCLFLNKEMEAGTRTPKGSVALHHVKLTRYSTAAVKTTTPVPPLAQHELFINLFIWALTRARPWRYSGGSFLIKPQLSTGWLMCSDACLFIQGAAARGQGDEGISLSSCCSLLTH